MKKQIKIGVADAVTTARDFIDSWKRAERGKRIKSEHKLNFQSLETLLKTLTPRRWVLLKSLHKCGSVSIRALAKKLSRDYKNVHTDVRILEHVGLIERTQDDKVEVPWDIIEARLQLAA